MHKIAASIFGMVAFINAYPASAQSDLPGLRLEAFTPATDHKLTTVTGTFYPRIRTMADETFVHVRTGPGLGYASSHLFHSGGLPAIGGVAEAPGEPIQWYKLDLGAGKTGFVSRDDLMSEGGQKRATRLHHYVDTIDDIIADAKKQNKGRFAAQSGLYVMAKDCSGKPPSELVTNSGYLFGLSAQYIWFDGDTIHSLMMYGTTEAKAAKLQPTRVFKANTGPIQFYKWEKEEIAFLENRVAFLEKFEAKSIIYKRAVKCDTDEYLSELKSAFYKDIDNISVDVK